jgi:hypothetical protein
MSVYAKASGYTTFHILDLASGSNGASFNLSAGTVTNQGSGTGTITAMGNGWYRCTAIAMTTGIRFYVPTPASNFTGDGTSGVLLWGAQVEAGAYATSYIPTLGTSVTRVAEDLEKASVNSLIGGTSGTIFFEIKTNKTLTNASYKQFFYYENASAAQAYMYLASNNLIVTNPPLGNITSSIALQADTTYKVAIAYAPNDFKLYINGVERGSSTSGTPINAVNILSIGSYQGSSEFNEMSFAQYLHFKTRLSNSDLATLTTL